MRSLGPGRWKTFVVCLAGMSVAFWGCATVTSMKDRVKDRIYGPSTPGQPAPGEPAAGAPPAEGGPPAQGQPPAPAYAPAPGHVPSGRLPSAVPGASGGPAAPGQVPAAETQYYVHVVKFWGESVSIIAGWYTGDIKNWEALAAANPSINPNRIVQGNRIRIPENMMVKHEPMPKEYVESFYPKGTPKPKPSAPSPPPEEEPALFGPKK